MANNFSLQPLVHLAQQRNDAATKKLGLLNRNQQSAQSKLEMLQQYRKDYQEKMHNAERNGMDLQDLRNFQDFIYRLDDAIAQQNAVVSQAHISLQTGRSELAEAQRRMKSFDTLAQRHAEAERKIEAKIEQRMQDEHSGRRLAYQQAEHLNEES
ncbi:MAG TPA: flagellar export protein FliJ [Gallionellaceae bacterium]|nr:flagellar export protein FliJ [Gallionellaceae bacterium]